MDRRSNSKQDDQINFDGTSSNLVPIEQLIQTSSAGPVDDNKIRDCPLNLPNQRVIKADAERTRIMEVRSVLEEHQSMLQSEDVESDVS